MDAEEMAMGPEDVAGVVAPWFAAINARVDMLEARLEAGLTMESDGYRLHVLTEAARLKVSHKELSKARALTDGDDLARDGVGGGGEAVGSTD
jgi:hypothetical protein